MDVELFDYQLPDELIAQRPAEPRDECRLLVLHQHSSRVEHCIFREITDYLKAGDTLVLNDTRVIPARIYGQKSTGAAVEVLLLHEAEGQDLWEALVRPGNKIKPGSELIFGREGGQPVLKAEVLERTGYGGRVIRFTYQGDFEEVLQRLGEMPLPPYITRELEDPESYQTIYARERGSAAAPTAGLHFTPELMERLEGLGVDLAYLTLHVGLGTFRPVSTDKVEEHEMHSEFYRVTAETAELLNQTRARGGRVIAVGTTATRTLETVACPDGHIEAGEGWTDIFIYPGYQFKAIDGLITNFHLPKSTLIMMVSALAGREKVLQAYRTAVAEKYRFFSFGDAMLII